MKAGKIFGLAAGAAAIAGAVWYLTKKQKEKKETLLYSQEFDEDPVDVIEMDAETEEEAAE